MKPSALLISNSDTTSNVFKGLHTCFTQVAVHITTTALKYLVGRETPYDVCIIDLDSLTDHQQIECLTFVRGFLDTRALKGRCRFLLLTRNPEPLTDLLALTGVDHLTTTAPRVLEHELNQLFKLDDVKAFKPQRQQA